MDETVMLTAQIMTRLKKWVQEIHARRVGYLSGTDREHGKE